MARMIGKQWEIQPCHADCCGWSYLGKSPNTRQKTKYKRHLKRQEKQRVKREINEEKEK